MRFPAIFAPLLRERTVCLGMLGVCAGLVVANRFGLSLWKCAFREVTGLPCPGCGLTRGMSALLRGRIQEAAEWNPFTPLFALAAVIMVVTSMLPEARRLRMIEGITALERRTGFVVITLAALFIYGLWRMWRGPWI